MGKFKARYVVVPLIIAGIVGGTGYYVYQKKQSEKVVNDQPPVPPPYLTKIKKDIYINHFKNSTL